MASRGDVLDYRGNKRSKFWSVNNGPSMTIQSDADESEINKILATYKEVGLLQNLDEAELAFMDVTEFTDFAAVVRQSKVAEIQFMKLPSKVREIFNHDVANWLDAAHDPEKRDALVRAGFVEAPEADGDGASTGTSAGDSAEGSEDASSTQASSKATE